MRSESYSMAPITDTDLTKQDRTVILKRNDLIIDEKECQVVNFIDISTYKRLKQEKVNNELLRTLNTTVHHEMLAPLRANVEICKRLLIKLKQDKDALRLVQIMLVSSQMVMMHANDLLDSRIIEKGSFVPNLSLGSIIETAKEMIELMNSTLNERELTIVLEKTDQLEPNCAKFDKRRLQQVLLNLLSNAVKYSHSGTILVSINIFWLPNQDTMIEIRVKDEGVGLKEETIEKLFKPFSVH